MIRQLLFAGISAAALAATPALAQEERAPAPTMEFGTWGFDPASIDQQVDPGSDFNAFANGKWIAQNPIPPEYSRFGAFNILGEKSTSDVEKVVADLVASNPAPGSPEKRLIDAYQAYEDTDAIEAAGLAPAQPYLDEIKGTASLEDLIALTAKPGIPSLVTPGVTVDDKDPNSYIVSVGFDGMGLPDRDYYLVESERNTQIRARYKDFLAFMLGQAGYSDPQAMADKVYDFEHSTAQVEWDRTAMRNSDITYNKLSRDEVLALDPSFPMERLLEETHFADQQQFLFPQIPPTADEATEYGLSEDTLAGIGGGTPAFMQLLEQTPLDTLKAFLAVRFLSGNASVLPKAIDDANFAFYGQFLSGQPEQRPRWKRAIASTEGMLGEQLGALYVDRYFPPESKAAMDDLVVNLRKALAASLEENDWMTPETRAQAMAKLNSFTPKVGYPDEFEPYAGLEIEPGDPLGNRVRATEWEIEDARSKLGGPVDRTEWGMLPQTVNAYYNPVFNEIVFPAAILQAPFFAPTADPAVNYGGIGAVIGHEMGHRLRRPGLEVRCHRRPQQLVGGRRPRALRRTG